jgi:hypothetical protein
MIDPSDLMARHLQHLYVSESELKEFLAQPVPRELPTALKGRGQLSLGNILGVFAAIGGPVCLALIVGPLIFRDWFGAWAFFLTGIGLTISVAAIGATLIWARKRPSLLRDGKLARAKFSFVDAPHRELLRSAASRVPVDDLHKSGVAKLEFSVDGQTVRTELLLPYQYLQLAAWHRESNADVFVLYEAQAPANAHWIGEFLFPCPKPPAPDISLGIDA